jgi:hypothetical protein
VYLCGAIGAPRRRVGWAGFAKIRDGSRRQGSREHSCPCRSCRAAHQRRRRRWATGFRANIPQPDGAGICALLNPVGGSRSWTLLHIQSNRVSSLRRLAHSRFREYTTCRGLRDPLRRRCPTARGAAGAMGRWGHRSERSMISNTQHQQNFQTGVVGSTSMCTCAARSGRRATTRFTGFRDEVVTTCWGRPQGC